MVGCKTDHFFCQISQEKRKTTEKSIANSENPPFMF